MIRVNGEPLKYEPGMTVTDVLRARNFTFRMIAVWINGTLVPRTTYASTVVPDDADVQVLHMIAGG